MRDKDLSIKNITLWSRKVVQHELVPKHCGAFVADME